VIVGSSGVGKSTLLNALFGEEVMRVSGLRSDGMRGAHTTTNRQMVLLPNGALLIDTPACASWRRGRGEGLGEAFADITELATFCRFRDCDHQHEPGCAVRKAVEDGALDPKRLKSWRGLGKEMEHEARKAEYRMRYLQRNEGKMKREGELLKDNDVY